MSETTLRSWLRVPFTNRRANKSAALASAGVAKRRRWAVVLYDALEERTLMSTTTGKYAHDHAATSTVTTAGQQPEATILVSSTVTGRAESLLSNSFALRPLSSQRAGQPASVIVTAADFVHPAVLELLKRSYRAGQTVALANATQGDAQALEHVLNIPSLVELPAGTDRAELISFRDNMQSGQNDISTSTLLPQDKTRSTTGSREQVKADKLIVNQGALAYLTKAFEASPVVANAQVALGDQLSLTDIAQGYSETAFEQSSIGAVQIATTVYVARSFTNQRDYYFVQQELDAKNYDDVPAGQWVVGIGSNAPLIDAGPGDHKSLRPATLQPSPQTNASTTTINSSVTKTISGSVGWSATMGFNASIGASVSYTNGTSTTVPEMQIAYVGKLTTGSAAWFFTQTNEVVPDQTTTVNDQWLWSVPLKQYPPGTKAVQIKSDGHLDPGTTINAPDVSLDQRIPVPFGDVKILKKPKVTGVSTDSVPSGEPFTIEGTALYPSLIKAVLIGGRPVDPANVQPISDTAIEVVAPDMGTEMPEPVIVKTTQGFSNSDVKITIDS